MIQLDGSHGEGGGQIIRTALALSTITGKPFTVTNIRQGRPKPGLKAQHLYCIKALKQLCNAEAEGAKLGSTSLTYTPKEMAGKQISIDIGTAGSITLLLQSLLLPCFYSKKEVRMNITGGTDVKWSMPFDYFKEVFIPHVKTYCEEIEVKLIRRGYYPKGGGKVEITVKPKGLSDSPPLNLTEKRELTVVNGISHASSFLQKANVAERQTRAAEEILKSCNIRTEYCETLSHGSGIVLWANGIGADSLGERGKKAEEVGKEAAEKLLKESRAAVDSHLADNLIPFLALFKGRIKVSEVTNHTLTNIYVVERFLGKRIAVEGEVIACRPLKENL